MTVARAVVPALPEQPTPRRAHLASFVDGEGRLVDQGLVLFFPAPASYTGEEVVELQGHGSPRLLQLLLGALLADPRVRLADPGEFSRRAFLNGRIDLARAEAVADLVAASSAAAVRAAAAQVSGILSERIHAIRSPLLSLRAEVEGALDFPEEADISLAAVAEQLRPLGAALEALVEESGRGRVLRRGARVVLFGSVNAGKSTLFNRLLREPRALVDAEPGTTRDFLEAQLELRGLSVTLVDTAGLRDLSQAERLEAMGIERTLSEVGSADLAIHVAAAGGPRPELPTPVDPSRLLEVWSKCDAGAPPQTGGLRVSGLSGEGLAALEEEIFRRLGVGPEGEAVTLTSERHAGAIRRAKEAVVRAAIAAQVGPLEIVAGELGLAAAALGEVTGEEVSEALLDEIFRKFCIGK